MNAKYRFIFQFVIFGKSGKTGLKIIMPLVELSARDVASELNEITKILTENTGFLIKRDYLRVNLCYNQSH